MRWFLRVRHTLRFRTTVVASLAVGVVLTIAAGALVEIENRLADADVDLRLTEDLDAVSAALFAGTPADDAADLADRATRVEITGDGVDVRRDWELDRDERRHLDRGDVRAQDRSIVVDGTAVTLTAQRSSSVDDRRGPSAAGSFWFVPMITALVAVVVWRSVGRVLRPVERLRADADVIAASGIANRLRRPGTRDEVDRLAVTLNSMLDQLAAADERQRRFVADAAHELRSPLAGLRARLETGGDPATDLEQVRRLQDLVDSLLLLSRSDAGQLHQIEQLVDLDEIVEEAILGLGPTSIAIDTTGVTPQQARGDHDHLGRIVTNLLDNAVRHAETTVRVSLGPDDGEVVIAVEDDGDGVGAADRERIFDRFVRLDESRARRRGGAGLGLAISSELARVHGGTLAVTDPTELGGACFELRLPATS